MVIFIASGFPGTDLAPAAAGGPEQAFHEKFDNVAFARFVGAVGQRQVTTRPVDGLFQWSAGFHLDPFDSDTHDAGSVP